jgi:hypothetical protein
MVSWMSLRSVTHRGVISRIIPVIVVLAVTHRSVLSVGSPMLSIGSWLIPSVSVHLSLIIRVNHMVHRNPLIMSSRVVIVLVHETVSHVTKGVHLVLAEAVIVHTEHVSEVTGPIVSMSPFVWVTLLVLLRIKEFIVIISLCKGLGSHKSHRSKPLHFGIKLY